MMTVKLSFTVAYISSLSLSLLVRAYGLSGNRKMKLKGAFSFAAEFKLCVIVTDKEICK